MEQRRDIENTKPACRLILASASPRRRELLERIGLKPEIHPSTLEENPLCTEPAQVVMELAGQKARDVMAQVREEARTTGIPFSASMCKTGGEIETLPHNTNWLTSINRAERISFPSLVTLNPSPFLPT